MRERDYRNYTGRHEEQEEGHGRGWERGSERQWGLGREGRGYGEAGWGPESGGWPRGRESGWYGEGEQSRYGSRGSEGGWRGYEGQHEGWREGRGYEGGYRGPEGSYGQYGQPNYGVGYGGYSGQGGQSSQYGGWRGERQYGPYGGQGQYSQGWGSPGGVPGAYSGYGYQSGLGYAGGGWRPQDREESRGERHGWRGQEDWRSHGREESWTDKIKDFFGVGPKGYRRSDERVCDDVNDRLTDDPRIDASDVTVKVKDCIVTLEGTVPNRFMKRLSEDVAESISGVHDVDNRLRVRRDEPPGIQQGEGNFMISQGEAAQRAEQESDATRR